MERRDAYCSPPSKYSMQIGTLIFWPMTEMMAAPTRQHDEVLSVLFKLIFAGLVAKEGYDFVTRESNK